MKKSVHVKINTVPGFQKDKIIELLTKDGVPISRFWRARIKDSETDNCLEIVKKPSSKNSSNLGSDSK